MTFLTWLAAFAAGLLASMGVGGERTDLST